MANPEDDFSQRDTKDADLEARFNSVIKKHGQILRQTIIKVCPKDVGLQFNDIEQDARLRLWHVLKSERDIQNLPSYICRIAVTATVDAIRRVKSKREEQLLLAYDDEEAAEQHRQLVADPQHAPDLLAERRQLVSTVEAALAKISENRRRAVNLHLQGMTKQEIGEILGWSEAKVRKLIYRGLQDLREQLRVKGVDYEGDY